MKETHKLDISLENQETAGLKGKMQFLNTRDPLHDEFIKSQRNDVIVMVPQCLCLHFCCKNPRFTPLTLFSNEK